MFVRTTACMGMTVLICAAASAGAPAAENPTAPYSPATATATAFPAMRAGGVATPSGSPNAILAEAGQPGAVATPKPAPRPQSRTQTAVHRRFHHVRHHVKASPAVPIGEIRSQIAQTVGLLNQLDENVRNQFTENRADAARLSAVMDGNTSQLNLYDKRIDGLDQRQAEETRGRRQDTALLETHIAEQGARISGVEQRIATVSAARANASLFVAAGLAGFGVLLGAIALVVSYRQRIAAVAAAENHADRLYRTYRAEFESLAQAARDLEARLQKTSSLPAPGPSMRLYPEPEPVIVRM